MSKNEEIKIERRRRQIAGMDSIIGTIDDKAVKAGWQCLVNNDFRAVASDEGTYRACCNYLRMVLNEVEWVA